jgi:REP element-mobilizing transposase RayT
MSRPQRIEFAGACYHVMARGNARERIYWDDEDRQRFLDGLSRVCDRFDWILWAYCLMDNHYHLLVETEQPTLSRGMREVNGTYSQSFNRRRGRVGHVLQGRYKAILVDKDAYLTELQRYIVLNPVRAGLCGTAGDWRWSSYPAVMGQAEPLPGLAADRTLSLFGTERAAARSAFARFVAEGVGQAFEPDVQAQSFLGDEAFVAKVANQAELVSPEVPRRQRLAPSLRQIEAEAANRNAAIRRAYATGAYTLGEIGAHFGLHYATISRIARQRQGG